MPFARPCTVCGTPRRGGNCPEHKFQPGQPKRKRRSNPANRGYNAAYRRALRDLRNRCSDAMASGLTVACVICERPILSMDDLTGEHLIPLAEQMGEPQHILGPAHRRCNFSRRRPQVSAAVRPPDQI